jgi:lipid-A-disaccharide synthase-like uncharacterized protein
MAFDDLLGYGGFFFLGVCWIPQTIATIKAGTVSMRKSFLVMYFVGAFLLMLQAIAIQNNPLILLNSYTTLASGINLFYGLFPREGAQ